MKLVVGEIGKGRGFLFEQNRGRSRGHEVAAFQRGQNGGQRERGQFTDFVDGAAANNFQRFHEIPKLKINNYGYKIEENGIEFFDSKVIYFSHIAQIRFNCNQQVFFYSSVLDFWRPNRFDSLTKSLRSEDEFRSTGLPRFPL